MSHDTLSARVTASRLLFVGAYTFRDERVVCVRVSAVRLVRATARAVLCAWMGTGQAEYSARLNIHVPLDEDDQWHSKRAPVVDQ